MRSDYSNSTTNFLKLIFMGFIIGLASITPGLSGGVIAISFGIYTAAINAIINIRHKFKQSCLFLIPLALGVGIGIIVFGIIMKPLLENYKTSIIYLFMGMIIGSLPSFLKESNKNGFRILYIIPLLITFSLGIILSTSISSKTGTSLLTPLNLIISGGVLSLGIIIPGISSSFILLQMGIYEKLINSFLSIDLFSIFWIFIGFVITSLLTIKLVSIAFNKFHGYAHFAALGFLLSSVLSVFPGFTSGIYQIVNLLLFVFGAFLVFLFMKKSEK